MARLVYHRKKDTGVTYVYEIVEEHWDKEKKQMRSKQRCIGKLDPITNDLIPSKRLRNQKEVAEIGSATAKTTVSGHALIFNTIDKEIGLSNTLKKSCPDSFKQIISLAWYLASTGDPLSYADSWCANHESPANGMLSSQRVSELLSKLSEGERQHFFKLWIKMIAEKDFLCYDISSISSYSKSNEYVKYGYNRDGEKLPQINLGIVYGQNSCLPATYRQLPGSITDVTTVSNLLDMFNKLEYPKLHLVLDRGFYSQSNITELAKAGYNFTIGVPIHLNWIKERIDKLRDVIDSHECMNFVETEPIYAHTSLMKWHETKRRCYLHIYYDEHKMAQDRTEFNRKLLTYKQEIERDKRVPEHEEMYELFFTCRKTPKRGLKIKFNDEAINKARKKYVGFSVVLSTKLKEPIKALQVYRDKDSIEKCFDDLKNGLDMKRLRVHDSSKMKSRLFIQFIALILVSQTRKVMREKMPKSNYTVKSLLAEMESLTTIHYSGKYKSKMCEMTKNQREILTAFDVEVSKL